MRLRFVQVVLTAVIVGISGTAPPVANGSTPPLEYLGRWKDTSYEKAPQKLCDKLLRIKPARRDNPIGCRFKEVMIIRYYRVADDLLGLATELQWRDYQISFIGPFGFWKATSRTFAQFDGTAISAINHKCPTEAAFIKISLEGCDSWHADKQLVHEVLFKLWCDPCIPGMSLSKVYWAQQWLWPDGNVGADMFFP